MGKIIHNGKDYNVFFPEDPEKSPDIIEGKTKIATSITNKGVATEASDSFDTMASNISKIETVATTAKETTLNYTATKACIVTITVTSCNGIAHGYTYGSADTNRITTTGKVLCNLANNGTQTLPNHSSEYANYNNRLIVVKLNAGQTVTYSAAGNSKVKAAVLT